MGIFQLTGNLDSPFSGLDKQGDSKTGSTALAKLFSTLENAETLSESLVPLMLTAPTATYVGLFLETDVKWYALGDDLNLIGRYDSETQANEAGATFVRRTPFSDFFALYENMNVFGDFQKIEDQFEASLTDHASFSNALGEDTAFFIDLCVYGQITMESAWDNSDSKGLWQITDIMADDLVERYDEYTERDDVLKQDPLASTSAAVDYYARMYSWFGHKCETIADHYGLNPRDFLIPCLLDAYHCGPGKMSRILDLFIEMVEEGLFEDLEGQEVYNQMSRMYFEDGEDDNYGRVQREYFYRAQAVASLMILQMSGYDVSQFREDLSIE